MFSSTNPFLHFTNDHDIFLHPQDPLLSTTHNFSFPADTPVATTALINYHMGMGASNHKKPTLKKDRHSKIRTAQGLRDRRVRLSIGIARKFFDLQDTLGFDKASETLEWLLTKSETSIMELTHRSGGQGGGNKISFSSTSECEVLSTTDEEVVNINGGSTTNKLRKAAIHNLSKELRVKARERARARTREKLCTRRINPHTLLGNCGQSVVAQIEELPSCHSLPNRVSRADILEESIVIKRMLKPPASNFAYHQNFVTAKDVSSIISNNYLPASLLPQTWDFSGALTCSSFYAMLNTNLSSSEFHVHGKPWEAQNNNQSLQ